MLFCMQLCDLWSQFLPLWQPVHLIFIEKKPLLLPKTEYLLPNAVLQILDPLVIIVFVVVMQEYFKHLTLSMKKVLMHYNEFPLNFAYSAFSRTVSFCQRKLFGISISALRYLNSSANHSCRKKFKMLVYVFCFPSEPVIFCCPLFRSTQRSLDICRGIH